MTKELRLSRLKTKHRKNTTWPPEKRIEAVSQYLILGNMALVSAVTGVDHSLLRAWKTQPWWKDVENQVRATENIQMDKKLSTIVDRSLDAVLDRVENGDFIYDVKTGSIKRKPVNMKDAAKVSTDLITKRELLRGNATDRKETTQISVSDQLKTLAVEFAKWAQKSPPEIIDIKAKEINHEIEGNFTDEVDEVDDVPFSVHDSDQRGRVEPPDEGEQDSVSFVAQR